MNKIPKVLYKYRDWGLKFNKSILENFEIYFSSPSQFNDPFDSTIPVRYDLLSKSEIIKKSYELLKDEDPFLSRKAIRSESKSRLKSGYYKNKKSQKEFQIEYRNKNFGIFSLSSDPKNIIMWSHYSNSHKGFCVGFDTEKLLEYIHSKFQHDGPIIDLYDVIYQAEYPIFDPKNLTAENFAEEPLRVKSSSWKYESEYRLISINID